MPFPRSFLAKSATTLILAMSLLGGTAGAAGAHEMHGSEQSRSQASVTEGMEFESGAQWR